MAVVPKALDFLRQRKKAYVSTFQPGTAAYIAFQDLAQFSGAFGGEVALAPDRSIDPERTLIMTGRREAFWRIYQHLNLDPNELAVLYRAAVLPEGET